MVYLLAIASAALYGAADFTGGFVTRRVGTVPVVFISQASGLVFLALIMPLLPAASPSRTDLLWGVASALTGGIGVALLYRALAIGTMAVVAPTTAVCAVAIPVVVSVLLGERLLPLAAAGIGLGMASIVLVSQQTAAGPEGEGSVKRSSGVGIALVSGVMIGFFFLCLAQTRTGSRDVAAAGRARRLGAPIRRDTLLVRSRAFGCLDDNCCLRVHAACWIWSRTRSTSSLLGRAHSAWWSPSPRSIQLARYCWRVSY